MEHERSIVMAKRNDKESDLNGEQSLHYVLDEEDSHSAFTEQKFLRILVNPVDVVSSLNVEQRTVITRGLRPVVHWDFILDIFSS